ncbi:MAG TPA: DnaJ domain-containing protein [Rhizomicrobium sp.]|nr:DnaJ domain-containing protein [Rhizomicrobium sp.]
MTLLILGLLVLIVIVAVLRGMAGRDLAALMKLARYAAIVVLIGLTLFFAVTERWVPAVFLAGLGWSLYTDGKLFPRRRSQPDDAPPPPRPRTAMSRAEALNVLGLPSDAQEDDIRAAHRRLILQNHPDKGGSDYLASKVNEAKDVLLG